jgi:hypothetical protein
VDEILLDWLSVVVVNVDDVAKVEGDDVAVSDLFTVLNASHAVMRIDCVSKSSKVSAGKMIAKRLR